MTDTSDGAIPLRQGPHSWLWKLSEVRSWPDVIQQHLDLGFVGAHLHSDGASLRRVVTRDLRQRWNDAGLDLGVSVAFDTGTVSRGPDGKETGFVGTPKEKLLGHILGLADLLGPGATVGLNWEMRWERERTHGHRKDDAAWLAREAKRQLGADVSVWDAPWWKPGVHGTAPTDEFGELMAFRVPQTYFVYGDKDPATGASVSKLLSVPLDFKASHPVHTPAAYMVETARAQYATRAVKRPLAWGFQGTASAGAQNVIGQCLRDYPVTMWWHFLRLYEPDNAPARAVFRAVKLASDAAAGPTLEANVRAFQIAHALFVDGWAGPAFVAKAREVFPAGMTGY